MKTIPIRTPYDRAEPFDAATFGVYVCSDKHVHVTMGGEDVVMEMVCDPEDALTLARKITEAADRALGV